MQLSTVSINIAATFFVLSLSSVVVEGFTFLGQKKVSLPFIQKAKQQQQQQQQQQQPSSSNTQLNFFKSNGGPAKSPDEDLELTRKVILGHIANLDDSTVAVEDSSPVVAVAAVDEGVVGSVDDEVVEMSAEEEMDGDAPKKGIRKKVLSAVQRISPFKN